MIFYYRLARELGMTVGRLLCEISSSEIAGWMAFLSLENDERQAAKRKDDLKKLKGMF